MPSFKELSEPVNGWTLDRLSHHREDGLWTVTLCRLSDGLPVVVTHEKATTAWREAVSKAVYHNVATSRQAT